MTTLVLKNKAFTIQDCDKDNWTLLIQILSEDKKATDEILLMEEDVKKLIKFLNDFYVKL